MQEEDLKKATAVSTGTLEEDATCANPDNKGPEKLNPLISSTCVKCNEHPSVTVFRNSSTCWPCIQKEIVHRFKFHVSRMKTTKNGIDKVLLCFSGGNASRLMLQLMHESVTESRKRMFFDVHVLHVNESSSVPLVAGADEYLSELRTIVTETTKFPCTILKLEDVFDLGVALPQANALASSTSSTEKLKALLAATTSQTSREDLVSCLRQQLIFQYARSNGFKKVLLGDTATRLAVNVFASTAKGRGFDIPTQIDLIDDRHKDFTIVRPWKDVLLKEIVLYNRFAKLRICTPQLVHTMVPPKTSLNQISENFILGLQDEFSHTVHTVLRSVDKLRNVKKTPATDDAYLCPLCSGNLTETELLLISNQVEKTTSTSNSIPTASPSIPAGVSVVVSSSTTDKEHQTKPSSNGCGGECDCEKSTPKTTTDSSSTSCCSSKPSSASSSLTPRDQIARSVCYGCKKLLHETSSNWTPPELLLTKVRDLQSALANRRLKAQIKDFLLDDNDEDD